MNIKKYIIKWLGIKNYDRPLAKLEHSVEHNFHLLVEQEHRHVKLITDVEYAIRKQIKTLDQRLSNLEHTIGNYEWDEMRYAIYLDKVNKLIADHKAWLDKNGLLKSHKK